MMYPTEKYRYSTNGRRVIAVSTYAGKTVRGVATCDPSDEFSMEKGKELAAARCALKIAYKRYDRATRKTKEAYEACRAAEAHHEKMYNYLIDSEARVTEAEDYLAEILNDL